MHSSDWISSFGHKDTGHILKSEENNTADHWHKNELSGESYVGLFNRKTTTIKWKYQM